MRAIEQGIRQGLATLGESCNQVIVAHSADGWHDWTITVTAGSLTPQCVPVEASRLDDIDTGLTLGVVLGMALRAERTLQPAVWCAECAHPVSAGGCVRHGWPA